jgi:hypothetical protein
MFISFLFDETGRFLPAAGLTSDTRNLKPYFYLSSIVRLYAMHYAICAMLLNSHFRIPTSHFQPQSSVLVTQS